MKVEITHQVTFSTTLTFTFETMPFPELGEEIVRLLDNLPGEKRRAIAVDVATKAAALAQSDTYKKTYEIIAHPTNGGSHE